MKCYNCTATAKRNCNQCDKAACRQHYTITFDEGTRAFTTLCGICYAKVRAANWVRDGKRSK